MNGLPSKKIVDAVKAEFPVGCRVELIRMDDPFRKMEPCLKGTVTCVDDTGTIFAKWENGSSLGAVYGVDKVRRLYKNTRIKYLYRDASNYKNINEVVVSGVFSEIQIKDILDCRYDGESFIPEQIGWPLIRGWDVNEDDHPFADIDIDCFEETDDEPTIDMTAEETFQAFLACKNKWNSVTYLPGCFATNDCFLKQPAE